MIDPPTHKNSRRCTFIVNAVNGKILEKCHLRKSPKNIPLQFVQQSKWNLARSPARPPAHPLTVNLFFDYWNFLYL